MQYLLALIAGATVFLGFSPYGLWYIALLSLLIFAALWRRNSSTKKGFALALAFNFGMFGTGVHWIYFSIHSYGQVPAPLAVSFTAGFAFFMALMSSLPWLLSGVFRNASRMVAFPAIWLLGEWVRGWMLTGFPWLYLGQAHLDTPLAGWISVVGVLGTGFILATTAALLICMFTQRRPLLLIAQAAALIMLWGGGSVLNRVEWTQPLQTPLSATLVQPNIALEDKWNRSKSQGIMDTLINQSEPHWGDSLIIWPEAAIPYIGDDAQHHLDQIDIKARATNSAFISGYLTYNEQKERFFNTIGGAGHAEGEYLKQRLVPFGEYVPLESWIRGLMHFFDLPTSIISAGEANQPPLTVRQNGQTYVAAPAICYEIAYPLLVSSLAKQANFIVTLSNDAWFGESIGPLQHIEIAQGRALENRKPVFRVTNNGITGSINHRGNIVDVLPQFQAGTLQTEIFAMSGTTPFSLYGNWPILLITLGALIAAYLWRQEAGRQENREVLRTKEEPLNDASQSK